MNIAHESKSNKTPLYLIGELIGVPNTVMDSALHELKDRIDKDPKYKDKFAYPCIEDVILLKHLGMFPFNKFMETPAVAVEPEKVSPLNKFL